MKFATLFRIALHHGFQADDGCKSLRLQACSATQARIKKMNGVVKNIPNGIEVLAEIDEDGKLRYAPAQPFRLRFWLVQHEDTFVNYTDLSIRGSKRIVYFANRDMAKNDLVVDLHPGDTATDDDLLDVLQVPNEISYAPDQPISAETIFGDPAPGISRSNNTLQLMNDEDDEGVVILRSGNTTNRVYACRLPKTPVVGVIELFADTDPAHVPGSAIFIDSTDMPQVKNYSARFAARSSYWKYLLTGKALERYSGLLVTDVDRTVFFDGPETSTLFDGSAALIFRSPERIPLRDKPTKTFQLRRNADRDQNTGSTLIDKLPAASVELIHLPRQPGSTEIVSEIIVHL